VRGAPVLGVGVGRAVVGTVGGAVVGGGFDATGFTCTAIGMRLDNVRLRNTTYTSSVASGAAAVAVRFRVQSLDDWQEIDPETPDGWPWSAALRFAGFADESRTAKSTEEPAVILTPCGETVALGMRVAADAGVPVFTSATNGTRRDVVTAAIAVAVRRRPNPNTLDCGAVRSMLLFVLDI
jgi:hypothetical protein